MDRHSRTHIIANMANLDGKRVERRRLELGLTQVQLAQKANVSQSTIDRVEKGHAGAASTLAMQKAIAGALGVSPAWLRGEDDAIANESVVDRSDGAPAPDDTSEGIDVEPLSKAISREHASGDWTDAEAERARKFVRETRRMLDPHADLAEVSRAILQAIRRAGVTASDRDIAIAWAQGKPMPPRR